MMTLNPSILYVGLDVAKLTLQADLAGQSVALVNTAEDCCTLVNHLHRLQTKAGRATHVVCEGTGLKSVPRCALFKPRNTASTHNPSTADRFPVPPINPPL